VALALLLFPSVLPLLDASARRVMLRCKRKQQRRRAAAASRSMSLRANGGADWRSLT